MRTLGKWLYMLCAVFLLMGCANNETAPVKLASPISKVTQPAIDIEQHLLKRSEQLITHLQYKEFDKFIEYVDPMDGALFSFFADFGDPQGYGGPYITLTRQQLANSEAEHIWGYDESGKAFEMTFPQYVNDFLLKRHGHDIVYTKVSFNKTALNNASIKNTIHEYYPNAKYVEYYSPPLDENSELFQAIRFVYQEREGEWYLIGIARDVKLGDHLTLIGKTDINGEVLK